MSLAFLHRLYELISILEEIVYLYPPFFEVLDLKNEMGCLFISSRLNGTTLSLICINL